MAVEYRAYTSSVLGHVLTAMVTPFDADGGVDFDAFQALARYLVENGSDGVVVAGTTGESPTLSDGERLDLEDEPLADPCRVKLAPIELGALRLGRVHRRRRAAAGVGRAAASQREGEREQGDGPAHPANLRS